MSEPFPRRNVLLIMADQFRSDHLGAAGAEFVHTPNLDRIAERGVRFANCFTNCPVCSPARIGLAAGLQPWRVGSLDNDSFLPASTPTFYQRFRDHSFRVGLVGKLDLAKPHGWNGYDGDRPCCYTYGFTHPVEIEGKMHAGTHAQPRGPYGLWLQSQGLYERFHQDYRARAAKGWVKDASHDSVLPTEAFCEMYIGRRACEWLEGIGDDFPWMLQVSFVGPHDPFDPPTEYAERFRDAPVRPPVPVGDEGKPPWIRRRNRGLSPDEVAHTRRQYAASIATIDEQVGRIFETLERRGMADNTVVVFTSDHGEMLGDHGLYTKTVAYEGSLHVPLLIAAPGIEGGRLSDAIVELIDVNPTICDLAGLGPQENIDAISLGPVLRGQTAEHRDCAISQIRQWRCIRTDRYKLIDNYADGRELYDLAEDPGEQRNLAEDRPDLVRTLRNRLSERQIDGAWQR